MTNSSLKSLKVQKVSVIPRESVRVGNLKYFVNILT